MKRITFVALAAVATAACVALLAGKADIRQFQRMRHM
jgi:hypothetical protein